MSQYNSFNIDNFHFGQAHDNKPLIIDTDVGVEKKTLLVKWMAYHQENSKKVCTQRNLNRKTKHIIEIC